MVNERTQSINRRTFLKLCSLAVGGGVLGVGKAVAGQPASVLTMADFVATRDHIGEKPALCPPVDLGMVHVCPFEQRPRYVLLCVGRTLGKAACMSCVGPRSYGQGYMYTNEEDAINEH